MGLTRAHARGSAEFARALGRVRGDLDSGGFAAGDEDAALRAALTLALTARVHRCTAGRGTARPEPRQAVRGRSASSPLSPSRSIAAPPAPASSAPRHLATTLPSPVAVPVAASLLAPVGGLRRRGPPSPSLALLSSAVLLKPDKAAAGGGGRGGGGEEEE
jgi:hypothetical protein